MSRERRQAPRVEIVGHVSGRAVSLDVDVHVREISLGGMSVETPFPFTVDAKHEFQLTLGDGSAVAVVARVRYSREMPDADNKLYISGFEFVDEPPPDSPLTIEDLLDRIK